MKRLLGCNPMIDCTMTTLARKPITGSANKQANQRLPVAFLAWYVNGLEYDPGMNTQSASIAYVHRTEKTIK
jgi:hypothetical protein